jgi:hypothetical protein
MAKAQRVAGLEQSSLDQPVRGASGLIALETGELAHEFEGCIVSQHHRRLRHRAGGRAEPCEPRACGAGHLRRGDLAHAAGTSRGERNALVVKCSREFGQQEWVAARRVSAGPRKRRVHRPGAPFTQKLGHRGLAQRAWRQQLGAWLSDELGQRRW